MIKWSNWRDQVSIVLILGILLMFAFWKQLQMPDQILGALIGALALVINFYFRKAGPSDNGSNGGTPPTP